MSQQLANIHDAFFKQVLSDPKLASTFLRERLPPEVAALLGSKLPPMEGADLSVEAKLRAFLKALKYGRRQDLPDRIDIVLAEAPVLEEKDLCVILTYLDRLPRQSTAN